MFKTVKEIIATFAAATGFISGLISSAELLDEENNYYVKIF